MICILDDALELDDLVRRSMGVSDVSVLFVPHSDENATAGCRMWGRDETRSLEQWVATWQGKELTEGPNASSHNQILVVWKTPDARLQCVLDQLAKKSPVELDVAIVIVGPILNSGQGYGPFETDAFLSQKVVLSNIWFLGNGCNTWPIVSEEERVAVIMPLLRLFLSEGGAVIRNLPLFRGAAVRRACTTAGTPVAHQPFITAFGLKSWEVEVAEIKTDAVRLIAATIAEQCSAGSATKGKSLSELSMEMVTRAKTTFATIAALGTPYDVQAGDTRSFPEQFSPAPVLKMSQPEWLPTRESFQSVAEDDLRNHAICLLSYRKTLKDELQAISRKIRLNAQRVYEKESLGMAAFVRSCRTLPQVTALLEHFIPSLARQSSSTRLENCEPASSPYANVWRRRSKELAKLLKDQLSALPTHETVHRVCLVSGAIALPAAALLAYLHQWKWSLLPLSGATLVVGALALYSRQIARRIMTCIEQKAFRDAAEFRQTYVVKLNWVLAKTQKAVENQIVGEALSISRKLGVNYRCFYASTRPGANMGGNPQQAMQLMATWKVDPVVASECGQEIEKAVEQLIDEALSPSAPTVGEAAARKLLTGIAEKLTDGVRVLQPGIETVKVDFSRCAADFQLPPIPARLPIGRGNSLFKRLYLLPSEYYDSSSWRKDLSNAGGLTAEVVLSQKLTQPMIINLRDALSQKETEASLTTGSSPV